MRYSWKTISFVVLGLAVFSADLVGFGLSSSHAQTIPVVLADESVGMHQEMDVAGERLSSSADHSGCATDFLCYLRCQESKTAASFRTLSGQELSEGDKGVIFSGDVDPFLLVQKPMCTSFSPPDDPGGMLSVLKRE